MKANRIITSAMGVFTICAILFSPAIARAGGHTKSNGNVKIFVEYKLAKDGILKGNNIDVAVSHGRIILDGTVATLHAKMKAAKEAGKIAKSYTVVNNLDVSAPFVPDSALAADVLHKVENKAFYTVFDWLTVGVNNGVVTLHGWVDEPWEVHQYAKEASMVTGVTRIVNDLRVEMSMGYLRYRVARMIYRDPFFWQYAMDLNPPVHVVVNNGTVILEGYVDSAGQRGYLGSEVTFRTDAVNVVNNLQVVRD